MLKLSAEDGRSGHFNLVEMDEGMARNVTAERVKRVAPEYANPKGSAVEACHELPSPAPAVRDRRLGAQQPLQ